MEGLEPAGREMLIPSRPSKTCQCLASVNHRTKHTDQNPECLISLRWTPFLELYSSIELETAAFAHELSRMTRVSQTMVDDD